MKQRFSFKMGEEVIAGDLGQLDVDFLNPRQLSQALADNPGLFAYWAFKERQMEVEVEKARSARDLVYAKAYSQFRQSPDFTVEDAKQEVIKQLEYQEALQKVFTVEKCLGILTAMRRGLEHRRDSLLELARNYRAEMAAFGPGGQVRRGEERGGPLDKRRI